MADELNTKVTADTGDFEAAMKRCAQEAQNLENRMQALTARFNAGQGNVDGYIKSLQPLQAQLNRTQSAMQTLTDTYSKNQAAAIKAVEGNSGLERQVKNAVSAMGEGSNAANVLGISLGTLGRRSTAVADEIAAGRYRQLAGTITSVVGTIAQANPVVAALGVALLALGGAFAYVARQASHAETAIQQARGEMLSAGTLTANTTAQLRANGKALSDQYGLTGSQINKITVLTASLHGTAQDYGKQIEQLAAQQQHAFDTNDAEKYAEELVKAFNKGGDGAIEWADRIGLLSETEKNHLKTIAAGKDDITVFNAIIARATEQWGNQGKAIAQTQQELKAYMAMAAASGGLGGFGTNLADIPDTAKLQVQPGPKAETAEHRQQLAVVDAENTALNKRLEIYTKLYQAQLLLNSKDASPEEKASAENAIAKLQQDMVQQHTVLEKQAHDKRMEQLQQELAAAKDDADQQAAIRKKMYDEDVSYEDATSQLARTAAKELATAEQAAHDQHTRMKVGELQQEQAYAHDSLSQQIAIQQRIIQVYKDANEQKTGAAIEANKRLAELQHQEADQEVMVEVDKLKAKQVAAHNHYDVILQIEDQILAELRKRYAEDTTAYQTELKRQEQLKKESENQKLRIAEEAANTQEQIARIHSEMAIERIRAGMNKDKGFSLHTLLGVDDSETEAIQAELDQVTAEYNRAFEKIKQAQAQAIDPTQVAHLLNQDQLLHAQYAQKVQQLHIQAAQATKRAWDNALNGVFSSFNSAFKGIITGTMTFQQAEWSIINSLGEKLLQIPLEIAENWIKSEIMKWVGVEAAQATGQAALGTSNAADVMSDAAVAAAGAYAATVSIPYVGPAIAPGAAAQAYADVAAFAPLAALDVGAWEVPQDMAAIIHKGETVVPADFASGLRSSGTISNDNSARNTYGPTNIHNNVTGVVNASPDQVASAFFRAARNFHPALSGRRS